jgi:hypothetical protein
LSGHLKFTERLAAVEYIVFEPRAEVGHAMYKAVDESLSPREEAQIGGEARPGSDIYEIAKALG